MLLSTQVLFILKNIKKSEGILVGIYQFTDDFRSPGLDLSDGGKYVHLFVHT